MITTPAPVCDIAHTLSAARAALGSSPGVRLLTARGTVTLSGLRGTARFETAIGDGLYGEHFDVAVMGRSSEIYDGRTVWARDISGGVHAYDAWFPRARARTDAFLATRAYLDPHSGASYACAGSGLDAGSPVVVIRVTPHDGIPASVAFDTRSHLPVRVSERFPTGTTVTRYGDYRTVGGLVLPFLIEQGSQAEAADGFAFTVRSYTLAKRIPAGTFARPVPLANAGMLHGARSTTIPAKLDGRQLLVWASIDGHTPMPFILDTGGHAILTTNAARKLGLRARGAGVSGGAGAGTIAVRYTRVASIRLGAAKLRDQPMLVIPYPYSFWERGTRAPIAGILGLEVFEHFAVRIDYGRREVTLAPFAPRRERATRALPIVFQDDMPMTHAAVDGHRGLFGVDTGNAGPLILFGGFLDRTGLGSRYAGGMSLVGHGTGGSNNGRLVRIRNFDIAGALLHDVPTDLTHMGAGSFSSWTEAGNLGFEVLSRFIPTFDYAHGRITLDRCVRTCVPPSNRSGIAFWKSTPAAFIVTTVKPGSAAARAGIVAGDRITAVDGISATRLGQDDLWNRVTGAKPVRLRIEHKGGATQFVTVP